MLAVTLKKYLNPAAQSGALGSEEVDGGERRRSSSAHWALQQKVWLSVYVKGCKTSSKVDLQSCPILQGSTRLSKSQAHKCTHP